MRIARRRPPAPVLARTEPRPWDPPQTEFPAVVPVSTLRFAGLDLTAIAITGIWAYSNGFEFFVTRLIRQDAPGWDEDPPADTPRSMLTGRMFARMSLRLADGSTVIGERLGRGAEPAGRILRPVGGGGSSHHSVVRWWAWPLPPGGPLEFICQLGAVETRVSMDAGLIVEASRQALRAWPEGAG